MNRKKKRIAMMPAYLACNPKLDWHTAIALWELEVEEKHSKDRLLDTELIEIEEKSNEI